MVLPKLFDVGCAYGICSSTY